MPGFEDGSDKVSVVGGLFKKKSKLAKFTPQLKDVWNSFSALDFDSKARTFTLAMDYELFHLENYDYRDRTRLKFDQSGEIWELHFGPNSTVPRMTLARACELIEVYYHRNEYIRERDHPASDTPAVQVLMLLRFEQGCLKFSCSDYQKFTFDYMKPEFLEYMREVAGLCGA